MNPEEFTYLEKFPVLVLGVEIMQYFDRQKKKMMLKDIEFGFTKNRKWLKIAHQTAGLCCYQHYLIGTLLKPREEIKREMQEINDFWFDSQEHQPAKLVSIKVYQQYLRKWLNVDCNRSYHELEEAYYPIDCTEENLKQLCSDKLPKALDDWLVKPKDKYCYTKNWELLILGGNSD